MEYSTHIVCTLLPLLLDKSGVDKFLAAPGPSLEQKIRDIVQSLTEAAERISQEFLGQAVDPERAFHFEHQVDDVLREAGRRLVQAVYHHAEPAAESLSPPRWPSSGRRCKP